MTVQNKILYIAKDVNRPEKHVYSSAKAYAGESCILDVTVLTLPWINY
jgi:hypothetical protein